MKEEKNEDEEDDEKVFIKKEIHAGYQNGIGVLQDQIQNAYNKKYAGAKKWPVESVLFFQVLIDNKGGCLKRIKLIEGKYTAFTEFIMEELRKACLWTPADGGGRPVTSYPKIFVQLKKISKSLWIFSRVISSHRSIRLEQNSNTVTFLHQKKRPPKIFSISFKLSRATSTVILS